MKQIVAIFREGEAEISDMSLLKEQKKERLRAAA